MSRVILKIDKVAQVVKGINDLVRRDVLVGIPDSAAERRDEDAEQVNNAALGYIHEFGSPARNIPARAFLIPGVRNAQDKTAARLKKAADAALDGQLSQVDSQLHAAGLVASREVKTRINSGDFVPLSDATLKARARKGRKGARAELERRAAGEAPSTDLAKPLIDSGQLRNAITYVVRGS